MAWLTKARTFLPGSGKLTDALALLDTGQISNSMTLIALQWLTLNHQRVTDDWLRQD